MKKEKVLIVSPCILPVPAVKGGAVLTLIESIIIQNEIHNLMDLTVVGSFYPDAVEKAKQYKNTQFIFLNKIESYEWKDKILDSIFCVVKRDEKKHQYLWKIRVIQELKKILLTNEYDKIIFENSGYLLNVLKDKKIRDRVKGKVFYHLHNDIPSNIYIEGVKECKLLLISRYLLKKVNDVCNCDMSNQAKIVKNGFDTNVFLKKISSEEKNTLKKQLGIPKEKKIIIFSGRLNCNKGIDKLLDAFTNLKRDDLALLIVGSHNFGSNQTSKFEKDLKEKFSTMDFGVYFTGFVPYYQMWKYYQLADLAVLPSMWEEPAGLTMLEASVSEVPVITTISGGIPEYLSKDNTYFIVRDNNIVNSIEKGIESILGNMDIWKEKAKNASKYVADNYSEQKYYESFVNAIR